MMSYADRIWLEGRRRYWTRPDAYRFARPGSPEAKMPGWLDPWATRVRMKEAAEDEERAREAAEQEELSARFLRCATTSRSSSSNTSCGVFSENTAQASRACRRAVGRAGGGRAPSLCQSSGPRRTKRNRGRRCLRRPDSVGSLPRFRFSGDGVASTVLGRSVLRCLVRQTSDVPQGCIGPGLPTAHYSMIIERRS